MRKIEWTNLIISVVIAELVGALSALVTGGYGGFLDDMERPPLSPPAILFPIVWAILYALMGIGAYLVYESEDSGSRSFALKVYAAQLAVNFVWSPIFFKFGLLGVASAVAVLLALLVAVMVWAFYKVRPAAAAMNLPYLAWSLFAAYLTIGTAVLN